MILHAIEELERQLQLHPESNIFLLTGTEEYLCHQALNLIRQRVLTDEARAFDYSEFDARETECRRHQGSRKHLSHDIQEEIGRCRRQLTKCRKPMRELCWSSCRLFHTKTVLVLSAPELDRRKHLYKQLLTKACIVEFSQLKTNELERWAQDYIRKQGIRISSLAH